MLKRNKVTPSERGGVAGVGDNGVQSDVGKYKGPNGADGSAPTPAATPCEETSSDVAAPPSGTAWFGNSLESENSNGNGNSDSSMFFNRANANTKSLSKSKRVKNYIHKKYKDVASTLGSYAGVVGNTSSSSNPVTDNGDEPVTTSDRQSNRRRLTTSWYVDNDAVFDGESNVVVTTGQSNGDSISDCDESLRSELEQLQVSGADADAVPSKDVNVSVVSDDTGVFSDEFRRDVEEDDDDDDNATITNDNDLLMDDQQIDDYSSCNTITSSISNCNVQERPLDVEGLVDRHLSRFYPNYERTRPVLVRQARDLLVCEFNGDLARFAAEYVLPAALLLQPYADAVQERSGVSPLGWPTSLGPAGVVLHLGELSPARLRPRDVYLCVKARPASLATVWRSAEGRRAETAALPETPLRAMDPPLEMDMDRLPELLHDLVVSVDREIERIPLDELAFPCLHCHELQTQDYLSCSAVTAAASTRDSCMQTSPMYEMDSSIPHIDSDEEHEDAVDRAAPEDGPSSIDSNAVTPADGSSSKGPSVVSGGYQTSQQRVTTGTITTNSYHCVLKKTSSASSPMPIPKSLNELPDALILGSGVYLPGLQDVNGRTVIVYDMNYASNSNAVAAHDVARLLLYYASVPLRQERSSSGVCLVVIETGNSSPNSLTSVCSPSSTSATIASVDYHKRLLGESLSLISPAQLQISTLLYYQNNNSSSTTRSSLLRLLNISSSVKCHVVSSASEMRQYVAEDQTPAACGGTATHDQTQWLQFFKSVEEFSSRCQNCGRRLVSLMGGEEAVSGHGTTSSSSRRQAHLQHRATARLLADPELQSLRRDAPATLQQLRDNAHWLPHSEDVRLWVERAERLYGEVDRAAQRLEALGEKRRERLRELARVRALEDETSEVLSWLSDKGEDSLKRHSELATTLPAIKKQELDFEKFYFISMRHLDKGGDLLEEAKDCGPDKGSGLKDLARSLKHHLRGFSERLEDTRERLEDTSRCFYLLDKAYEWALEAMKYMSRVKPEENQSTEPSVKQLRQYLMAHPPLSTEHFTEMMSLAKKLNNDKLLEQCKVAQCRCEETMEQIRGVLGAADVPSWSTSTPLPGRRRSLPNPNHTPGHSCPCWDPGDSPQAPNPVLPLDEIREECSCCCRPSHPLQRSCTWQYPTENYEDEDKFSSSADNTTEGSETGTKSGSENEDSIEAGNSSSSNSSSNNKTSVPPIPVNSHLHCDLSLQLDNTGKCGTQTLKTKKTLLLIMREMIHTERDYVKSLEYVIENYIPELVREDIPQALRGQRNVVFGNIEKIYEFHSQFFLQELERCEQSPLLVGQFFLRHESKFYLYALYNKNKPKSDSLMSEYGTAFFKRKQMELGDRMDLGSYLLKPVQRMGKYALLLQQLMKASRQDVPELRDAETMVRFQLRHGNDLLAMDSLRDCDVNVKEQGRLLRQNEFLVWQGKGKKCLRHVFLFEELILFSKARRFPDRKNLDIYIYKNSIKTSDIGFTARIGDSTTKFEIWFRKRKPNDTFTLQSMSEDVKQAWTDELSNLLWKQALRNREMRMAEMSSMGIGNKPCLDIRPSADQISDRSISIAQLSKTAPRFRNSIAVMPTEHVRKRPHSIISVTSSSSSGASSQSSNSSGSESHRLNSQCSSAESGIVSDWAVTSPSSSLSSESTTPSWSSDHH